MHKFLIDLLKILLINSLTIWIKRSLIKISYIWRYRGSFLSINNMVKINNCKFGIYNTIYDNCELNNVLIGDFSYIGSHSRLNEVSIGKFTCIAQNVIVGLGIHPVRSFLALHPAFYSVNMQTGYTFVKDTVFEETKPCIIGSDVWIGARVTVLDGVCIGDGAVIAAGAVITTDVPPYAIMGGVPAKIIRYRFDESEIATLLAFQWWNKESAWIEKNSDLFRNVENLEKITSIQ